MLLALLEALTSTSKAAVTFSRKTTPVLLAKTTGCGAINATGSPSLVIPRSALARRLVFMTIPEAGIMCFNKGLILDFRAVGLIVTIVSYFGLAGTESNDVHRVRLLIMMILDRRIMLLKLEVNCMVHSASTDFYSYLGN